MDNILQNLTVVIVTYKTSINMLTSCLKAINKEVKTVIVENSKQFEEEEYIKKNFSNVKIFCTGSNLGMGAGNNFGITKVKTRYVLTLNPDIICDENFFENVKHYLNNNINFSLIGTQYKDGVDIPPAFFFDNKKFEKNLNFDEHHLQKVDWVVGCSILFDLSKFDSKKLFDENFFLFYEETDLCLQLKKKGQNVFSSKKLLVDHLGAKGSLEGLENETKNIKIRNWHLMWSTFYYNKKNYGFIFALIKSIGPLIRSLVKLIFYGLILRKKDFLKYLFRSYGLLSSILGMKSSYRIE